MARLCRRRARHALEQTQQRQQRQQRGEEKHVAPVQLADDGAAEDGAGQGREDGGARQNAAELDGRHVVEQFMDHGIADEDEAAAHTLDEARSEKLLDGIGKRHGQGGQQEQGIASQHQLALADGIGQRSQENLQRTAAQQIQAEGQGNEFFLRLELANDAQHGRHDHVVRQIDIQLKNEKKRKKPQQLPGLDGHGAFRNVGGCRQCVPAVGAWDGGHGSH